MQFLRPIQIISLVLFLSFLLFRAVALGGQALVCAHALSTAKQCDPSCIEEFTAAYRFVIGEVGAKEISVHELQGILDAGLKDSQNFFLLQENGRVLRGQLQSALNELKKLTNTLDRDAIKNALAQVLRELITQKINAKVTKEFAENEASSAEFAIRELWKFGYFPLHLFITPEAALFQEAGHASSYIWNFDKKDIDFGPSIPHLIGTSSEANYAFMLSENRAEIVRRDLTTGQSEIIVRADILFPHLPGFFSISPDGEYLVAMAADGTFFTWDKQLGQKGPFKQNDRVKGFHELNKIELLPASKKILLGEPGRRPSIRNPEAPDSIEYSHLNFHPRSWGVSHDSKRLAAVTRTEDQSFGTRYTIAVYSLPDLVKISSDEVLTGDQNTGLHSESSSGPVAISPDGNWLAAFYKNSHLDGRIYLKKIGSTQNAIRLELISDISAIHFLPDNKRFLIISSSGKVGIVNIQQVFNDLELYKNSKPF